MTSEQITELRKLYEGCIAQDLGPLDECVVTVRVYRENAAFLIACNNSIRQLLDEREALLGALKEAQRIIDGEVCSTNEHGADCKNLLAVIAKAESP